MSDLDAIKFLLDGSYRGAESKFKNQIKSLKQENEILKNRVADLEAKLAESNEQLQMAWDDFHRMQNEKIKVQHQLAEKEKEIEKEYNDGFIWEGKARDAWDEIEKLKQQLAEKDKRYGELHKCYNEDLREKYRLEDELKVIQKHHQDKISFALEQLNATYRLLNDKAICVTGTSVNAVRLYTINEVFKSQIEELKKEIHNE